MIFNPGDVVTVDFPSVTGISALQSSYVNTAAQEKGDRTVFKAKI